MVLALTPSAILQYALCMQPQHLARKWAFLVEKINVHKYQRFNLVQKLKFFKEKINLNNIFGTIFNNAL